MDHVKKAGAHPANRNSREIREKQSTWKLAISCEISEMKIQRRSHPTLKKVGKCQDCKPEEKLSFPIKKSWVRGAWVA